jgi:phosphatidylserine/phosphatidylglycerophosphate/cardiolipin synthase-like enzyme
MAVKCDVRLITGSDQTAEVLRLLDNSARRYLKIRVLSGLHAKFVVFDSILHMTGSANLTGAGLGRPAEVVRLVVDEESAQAALQDFFELWDEGSDLPMPRSAER